MPRPNSVLSGAAIASGLLGTVIFVGFPQTDIMIMEMFYFGPHDFSFSQSIIAKIIRFGFQATFCASVIIGISGLVLALRSGREQVGFSIRNWSFMTGCLVIGPGIVANSIFKNHWGRARPINIEEFGGSLTYSPPMLISDACNTNCSFFSGEAAAIFMLFFALGLVMRRYNYLMFTAGAVAGTMCGILRMGLGGHFFSDIFFAGVFMALLASLMHWVTFALMKPVPARAK